MGNYIIYKIKVNNSYSNMQSFAAMAPMPNLVNPTQTDDVQFEGGQNQTNVVKMITTGMSPEFGQMKNTIKTGSIKGLPCGNCSNFVNTIPVEAKHGIPAYGPICCILLCLNGCNCWYKRLEHTCPNCGVQMMVCEKPVRSGCGGIR